MLVVTWVSASRNMLNCWSTYWMMGSQQPVLSTPSPNPGVSTTFRASLDVVDIKDTVDTVDIYRVAHLTPASSSTT